MKEFIKELAQLSQDRIEAITKGLQNQIVAQANMVRDDQPDIYLSYLDGEIESASNAMLKMVKASGQDGAILDNISEVYIWNKERKRVLMELRDKFISQQPQSINPEPQQISQVFTTDKAKCLFESAIAKGLVSLEGEKYRWNDTASLYGYFVDKTSNYLDIRPSNNRIPWKKYEVIVTNHTDLLATAKQAVNDYKNKELPPPEGDDKVNDICK